MMAYDGSLANVSMKELHMLFDFKSYLWYIEAVMSLCVIILCENISSQPFVKDAEVVDHNPQYSQRCTLEAWHIRTEQHKCTKIKALFQGCTTHLSTYHTFTNLPDYQTMPLHVSMFRFLYTPLQCQHANQPIVHHFIKRGSQSHDYHMIKLQPNLAIYLYSQLACQLKPGLVKSNGVM